MTTATMTDSTPDASVSSDLPTEPEWHHKLTENGFGNGSGYGVKVYYEVVNGEWEESGESLLITQRDDYAYTFSEGTEAFNLRNNEMSFLRTNTSDYVFNPIIELDMEAENILDVMNPFEISRDNDGLRYMLVSADGRNVDRQTENYDSATDIEYDLVLKTDSLGTPLSGVDPVTGKINLDDYEWKILNGWNVQTINNYEKKDRHVHDPERPNDPRNYQKYSTTITVNGESEEKYIDDEWKPPTGEVVAVVVDQVIKEWYYEEKEPITLFGESVTQTTVNKGKVDNKLELTQTKTKVAKSVAPSGYVYSGTGEQRIEAHTTQEKSTSGSEIASYSKSETEWFDRTLTHEITNNLTGEWSIVAGEGTSGGNRKSKYNFDPEETKSPYYINIYNTPITLDGTSTFTDSWSGFYSDSYKGMETYNTSTGTWKLVTGSGSGNGENKLTMTNELDAELFCLLATDTFITSGPTGPTYQYVPYYANGNYTSYFNHANAYTITTTFTVDNNGAWECDLIQTNVKTLKEGYDFSFDGSCTRIGIGPPGDTARTESGKLDRTTVTTEKYRPVAPGNWQWISFEEDIAEYKQDHIYKLYSITNGMMQTETYDQEYTETKYKEGVSPGTAVQTAYTIEGTASGMFSYSNSSGGYLNREFRNGRIYSTPGSNQASGMSEAFSDCSNSINSDPTFSHDWMAIDYNGFTNIQKGENITMPKAAVKTDFDAPHARYSGMPGMLVTSVSFEFNNYSGHALSFGNWFVLPPNTFESGLKDLVPEGKAPEYVPLDETPVPEVVDPIRDALRAYTERVFPNTLKGMEVIVQSETARDNLLKLLNSGQNVALYSVTGIRVQLENGEWVTNFDGYATPANRMNPKNIYMTDKMSGAAWAGLLIHEISHIVDPKYVDPQERFPSMKARKDKIRYLNELSAYNVHVKVLNDLYELDVWGAKEALGVFPFAVYNPGNNKYFFDKDIFETWFWQQQGYQHEHIYYDFPSRPLGFTIRVEEGNIVINF